MTAARHHPGIVESPSGTDTLRRVWRSEDDTAAFARALAAQPALANAFVTLHGDLGAGKTTFVRHLLRALGVQGRIKSPTYAVVEPHDTAAGPAWHFDFYRFGDPREWEDAGFRDIFAGPGLKLAEWPEKATGLLPAADLVLQIEASPPANGAYDGDGLARLVLLRAGTPLGRTLVQALPAE
ncbi:tRNA (adenosine(37)-N6)-threonylcarbamoyltransferase complex ATPase subunit type 1 TsaE [Paracidovorax avenae]|uniref:tRNA (adenosine(37)-N6)-threonylcarbamoyltransferase complex ATPase subunit type 1 TsaE n=1 Tax=Paracidovorax avenae TaxID=80867 RepID=UPI000D158D6C|nr:tRNA (adenosine(37)-N6)-threonylcarbamoyltransferase complex ATPase subunit type 1 TsaE [Paracidovorax avenae]AVS87796.1 tRNA (adenosine(37)-N6)-threonylcarbamoyltransferase complex ATPase subunit type 1 TsaE [Paracidovorax avenae]AVS91797.1 tRNA (adenosine(37)-N6)-threonylcarbamoyltransferase complex ATPase subunit type 1 TsaE [Paracidovorax avenae]